MIQNIETAIEKAAENILRLYKPAFSLLAMGDAVTVCELGDDFSHDCPLNASFHSCVRLTLDNILFLHKMIAQKTGGDGEVRDRGLLESAVEAAFLTFDGIELYPTVEEKGARLCCSLVANHAFVDGNKRIGVLALMVFLEINGVRLRPTNCELARVGLALASGQMRYEELVRWVLDNK